jgi:hypothetical protein
LKVSKLENGPITERREESDEENDEFDDNQVAAI